MGGKENSSQSFLHQKGKSRVLRDGPGPPVTAAPSSPAWQGHRDIMVSASTALLGTPPCSPRPPRLSPPIPATPGSPRGASALPSAAPSPVPACQGPAHVPAGEGTVFPSWGQRWVRLWGGCGCWCPPGQGGDHQGMGLCWHRELWVLLSLLWYPQDKLLFPVVPSGASAVSTAGAGGAGGAGVAATCPRPGGTLGCCPQVRPAGDGAAGRMWGCREGSSRFWELF